MAESWIKKIVKQKQQQDKSYESREKLEERVQERFESGVDDLWMKITESIRNAIEYYNENLPREDRVAFQERLDDVCIGEKKPPPSGRFRVQLNREARRVICSYEYADDRGNPAFDHKAFDIVVDRWGLRLESSGRRIKDKEIAPEILVDFFYRL